MKKSTKMAFVAITFAFFVHSFINGTRGVFLPQFKLTFALSDTFMGGVNGLLSAVMLVSSLVAGELCARIGNKGLAILSLGFYGVAILGLQWVSSPVMFVVFYAFTGLGASSIAVAVNTAVPALGLKRPGRAMSIIHFAYGVGASIALLWMGGLIPKSGWQSAYLMIGIIIGVAVLFLTVTKFPVSDHAARQAKAGRGFWKEMNFWMLAGVFGFYLTAELALINWFPNYMKFALSMPQGSASKMAALFFVFLTIGRLGGSVFIDRFSYKKIAALFMGLMITSIAIGLLIPAISAFMIAFSGFFASICIPTLMLVMNEQYPDNSMRVIGAVNMVAAIVRMAGEFLVGTITQRSGAAVGFWLIPFFLVLSLGILIKLIKTPRRN
jgi:fucose permease